MSQWMGLSFLPDQRAKRPQPATLNLKTYTGEITLSVSRSTETSDKYLVVLIDEGHTTISWDVSSNSFVVFLELDSHTLSDGRVGLLGLDGNFFNDDSCSVGGASERFL